jgi:hypothetical protein
MRGSKVRDEPIYALTIKNQLFALDSELEQLNNLNHDFESRIDDQLYSFDITKSIYCMYLQSNDKIYLFDRRAPKSMVLSSASVPKSAFTRYYAVRDMREQYYVTSNNRCISFYDIRSPNYPILNINHNLEYNPPELIEFSKGALDVYAENMAIQSTLELIDGVNSNANVVRINKII